MPKSHHQEFMEHLMRDFDGGAEAAEVCADSEDEDDEEAASSSSNSVSRSCYEKRIVSRANSEKAIQIIKENSEILDKILRKKGERYSQVRS